MTQPVDWATLVAGIIGMQVNGVSAGTPVPGASLNFLGNVTVEWNAANNSWDVTVSSVPAGLPTRGLTTSLNAALGVYNVSGNVTEWFDQAPARAGLCWSTVAAGSNPATFNASGFNSKATIDFSETTPDIFQYLHTFLETQDCFVKPDEFSFACCLEYTGTKNATTNQICPIVFGLNTSDNPRNGCGLTVGLDPGNSSNCIFAAYVSDSNGGSAVKYVQSVSVPTNVAHYVVVTFVGGVLTLYLDALAPVSTSGIGTITVSALTINMGIGGDGTSTSTRLNAHVRALASWCNALTTAELAQAQAFLKSDGGL